MRTTISILVPALALLVLGSVAQAIPTIDGTRDPAYGPPLAVQITRSGFGNNLFGDLRESRFGSELDAIYARIGDDAGVRKLFVMITGNLETGNVPGGVGGNFNKLEVVIDSIPGGQNVIDNSDPLPIVEAEGTPGLPDDGQGVFATVEGTRFDAEFEADYWLVFVNGYETPSVGPQSWALTAHYGEVKPVSLGGVAYNLGGTTDPAGTGENANGALEDATNNDGDAFDQFWIDRGTNNSVVELQAAVNNSNTGGVPGGMSSATPEEQMAAAAVTTGFEFAIPLSSIGNPTGNIKINAWINGSTHDFASNQFLAGLGDFGNLANGSATPPPMPPGAYVTIDLDAIAGKQFVSYLPGDMDCDGDVDFDDIDDFVLGLNNPALYESNLGLSPAAKGDTDLDGDLDFDDIPGFVSILSGGQAGADSSGVPEPSSLGLVLSAAAVSLWGLIGRRAM